jgi:hypothetical protein
MPLHFSQDVDHIENLHGYFSCPLSMDLMKVSIYYLVFTC